MTNEDFKHLLGELIFAGADELEEDITIIDYSEA